MALSLKNMVWPQCDVTSWLAAGAWATSTAATSLDAASASAGCSSCGTWREKTPHSGQIRYHLKKRDTVVKSGNWKVKIEHDFKKNCFDQACLARLALLLVFMSTEVL